jgi:hypothetical protein
MPKRVRTTISLTPEAHAIFKRMADAANMSLARCMGDWLADTSEAALLITVKIEEARKAPLAVMREMQALVAGMTKAVDQDMEKVREVTSRSTGPLPSTNVKKAIPKKRRKGD